MAAYAPVLDSFGSVASGPVKPPAFVYGIVVVQFILFFGFGFTQLHELWSGTLSILQSGTLDPSIPRDTTRRFIFLSLIAKTSLAWLILSPILVDAVH